MKRFIICLCFVLCILFCSCSQRYGIEPAETAPYESCLEYYIVEQNGLFGVVDGSGNVTLPIQYESVTELYRARNDAAYFLMLPGNDTGQLYTAYGKQLSEDYYADAYLSANLSILVMKHGDDKEDLYGILNIHGKTIVPCQYDEIEPLEDGFIAIKWGDQSGDIINYVSSASDVDVYSRTGELLRSSTINYSTMDFMSTDLMLITDESGRKYGLMNDEFEWVLPADYHYIETACSGQYIVMTNNGMGVVDGKGNQIVPDAYGSVMVVSYADFANLRHPYYAATTRDGAINYLFDDTGTELFHSKRYDYISYQNGILVREDTQSEKNACQAVNEKGRVLFSADMIYYDDFSGIYTCETYGPNYYPFCTDYTAAYYTKEGRRMALAEDCYLVQILSENRYIMNVYSDYDENSEMFLCDETGRRIGPSCYSIYDLGDGKTLLFSVGEGTENLLYGLMNYDGDILLEAVYTELIGYSDQELTYASTQTRAGLIDKDGNWIWAAFVQAEESPSGLPFDI